MTENKTCIICKETKQILEMVTNRNRCKKCHTIQQRLWRKTEKGKAYTKQMSKKRKQVRFRLKVLSKSCCRVCGESDISVLEFDHIDPTTKKHNISKMVKVCMPISEIKEEMRKCQILCFNCHVKKTKLERSSKIT